MLGLLGSDFKHHLGPFLPGQHLTPYADCYRCPLRSRYPDCGIACADYVRDVIRYQTAGEIAAIIVEPMQGTAGNVIPPEGFLRAVQQVAKDAGALLIADEMITGFGRTGLMWGAEHDRVVPDIMTVGKGVGGGFPLSAVISTDDLTAAASPGPTRARARRATAATRSRRRRGSPRSRSSSRKTSSRTPSAWARSC